ncbi:MAG: CorA metal ion transporter [Phylliscum demangeonii]|nr:MAG: CorA metal ion transporter [Phylliscum demangeonii]
MFEHEPDDALVADDRTPLISVLHRDRHDFTNLLDAREHDADRRAGYGSQNRLSSTGTSASARRRNRAGSLSRPASGALGEFDINNPPSMPGSPQVGAEMGYDDVMVAKDFLLPGSPQRRARTAPIEELLINIGDEVAPSGLHGTRSSPPSPRPLSRDRSRKIVVSAAEEDVCFPVESLSEMADEDGLHAHGGPDRAGPRRRRGGAWPDLSVLEAWSMEERQERSEGIRAKKISEPVLVGGRLRPNNRAWHRMEEDAPYRFTYFNEELSSTIHSQTISELLQPGQTFRELFVPDPPELSDDETDDDDDQASSRGAPNDIRAGHAASDEFKPATRHSSILSGGKPESREPSGETTPLASQGPKHKSKRYGPRPVFWLDVLSPNDTEMKVIAKAFGIHPLTTEDIMMQEAREKVELFRNYYFVNYRTFEQDINSEHYLDPVNQYVVVFREGVISFHFSMVPHAANVRRRIRQLKDYLILSSDWISYAIIDDITDAFAPLSQSLEDEVDEIEDAILRLHSSGSDSKRDGGATKDPEKRSDAGGDATTAESGGDMLRRVGDCRKKVMGLYRLLGNKADVIKGFAKRCTEQWEVAPRSEIGLYLGDIQDHIVTMTGNLSHCESVLSRSHSNYLAQINIRMNERQEQTADVLGRLTVLGTIVLPMNIITGLWGMNCLVPGQGSGDLSWFWAITGSLLVFAFLCYFIAKRVYGIV